MKLSIYSKRPDTGDSSRARIERSMPAIFSAYFDSPTGVPRAPFDAAGAWRARHGLPGEEGNVGRLDPADRHGGRQRTAGGQE